jgi:cell cycle sensor histidine kinase DivJ
MEELNKAKTEFIPIISHQLRTLLSVISWYTEMLIDGDAGKLSVKQKKYLKAIYSGNQHMVELLNSLLNVSKIELGALAIEPEETDISELANCHPLTILDTRSLPERLKLLTYNEWALAHS